MDKETINDSKNLLEDPPNKTDSKDIVLSFNVYMSCLSMCTKVKRGKNCNMLEKTISKIISNLF